MRGAAVSEGQSSISKDIDLTLSSQMQSPAPTRWQGAHPDVDSQVPLQGQSRLCVVGGCAFTHICEACWVQAYPEGS